MTEIEALYRRRRHLLEQIGKASDEINRIDERLAYLISPTFEVDRPMMKSEYYTILKKRAESLSLKQLALAHRGNVIKDVSFLSPSSNQMW